MCPVLRHECGKDLFFSRSSPVLSTCPWSQQLHWCSKWLGPQPASSCRRSGLFDAMWKDSGPHLRYTISRPETEICLPCARRRRRTLTRRMRSCTKFGEIVAFWCWHSLPLSCLLRFVAIVVVFHGLLFFVPLRTALGSVMKALLGAELSLIANESRTSPQMLICLQEGTAPGQLLPLPRAALILQVWLEDRPRHPRGCHRRGRTRLGEGPRIARRLRLRGAGDGEKRSGKKDGAENEATRSC